MELVISIAKDEVSFKEGFDNISPKAKMFI